MTTLINDLFQLRDGLVQQGWIEDHNPNVLRFFQQKCLIEKLVPIGFSDLLLARERWENHHENRYLVKFKTNGQLAFFYCGKHPVGRETQSCFLILASTIDQIVVLQWSSELPYQSWNQTLLVTGDLLAMGGTIGSLDILNLSRNLGLQTPSMSFFFVMHDVLHYTDMKKDTPYDIRVEWMGYIFDTLWKPMYDHLKQTGSFILAPKLVVPLYRFNWLFNHIDSKQPHPTYEEPLCDDFPAFPFEGFVLTPANQLSSTSRVDPIRKLKYSNSVDVLVRWEDVATWDKSSTVPCYASSHRVSLESCTCEQWYGAIESSTPWYTQCALLRMSDDVQQQLMDAKHTLEEQYKKKREQWFLEDESTCIAELDRIEQQARCQTPWTQLLEQSIFRTWWEQTPYVRLPQNKLSVDNVFADLRRTLSSPFSLHFLILEVEMVKGEVVRFARTRTDRSRPNPLNIAHSNMMLDYQWMGHLKEGTASDFVHTIQTEFHPNVMYERFIHNGLRTQLHSMLQSWNAVSIPPNHPTQGKEMEVRFQATFHESKSKSPQKHLFDEMCEFAKEELGWPYESTRDYKVDIYDTQEIDVRIVQEGSKRFMQRKLNTKHIAPTSIFEMPKIEGICDLRNKCVFSVEQTLEVPKVLPRTWRKIMTRNIHRKIFRVAPMVHLDLSYIQEVQGTSSARTKVEWELEWHPSSDGKLQPEEQDIPSMCVHVMRFANRWFQTLRDLSFLYFIVPDKPPINATKSTPTTQLGSHPSTTYVSTYGTYTGSGYPPYPPQSYNPSSYYHPQTHPQNVYYGYPPPQPTRPLSSSSYSDPAYDRARSRSRSRDRGRQRPKNVHRSRSNRRR